MSLIVNGTEIENVIVVKRATGESVEIEKLQDQNGNVIWEKQTIPQVMLMPMYNGTPVYSQISEGTATETGEYYKYDPNIGDFAQAQLNVGDSIIGYYLKGKSTPAYYLVWGYQDLQRANVFGLKEITIPSKYNGIPVLGIISYAFYGDTDLEKVVIEEGIEVIDTLAFGHCSNLSEISLPTSLATFRSNILTDTAIYNNPNYWENDVLTINNKQIKARETITTANIGEHITGIALGCYSSCLLTTINLNSNNLVQQRAFTYISTTVQQVTNETGSYRYLGLVGINEDYGYFTTNTENRDYPNTTLNLGSNVKKFPTGILLSGSTFTPSGSSAGSNTWGGINVTTSMLSNYNINELRPYCLLKKKSNTGLILTTTAADPFIIPRQITSVSPYACAGGSAFSAIEYFRVECDVLAEGMFAAIRPVHGNNALYSAIKGVEITGNPTEIPEQCFYFCYQITEMSIPASVRKIGAKSFNPGTTPKLTKLIFNQPSGVQVEFPTAGSSTGAFYYKSAYSVSIYTDNESVKNYAWATDNVTATFYHLDGTAW